MSDFIAELIDLNIDDTKEGIYAGSGSSPNPGEPETTTPTPPPSNDNWSWECRWDGHNSGGHSVCHFQGTHSGNHSGSHLELYVTTNFPIQEVKNASGLTIANVGLYCFTLIRNNHYNANDSIGFCAEIVTSQVFYDENNHALHGAIGANNANSYGCTVQCTVAN